MTIIMEEFRNIMFIISKNNIRRVSTPLKMGRIRNSHIEKLWNPNYLDADRVKNKV